MNRFPVALILAALLAGFLADPACAQIASDSVPAPGNVGSAAYPRLHPDRSVSFQIKAPSAQRVVLRGGAGLVNDALPMERGENGIWAVRTPPAAPGFHYYWFEVDGLNVQDPASYSYFGYGRETSGVEVPDEDGAFYQPRQDIPRGTVREHWYFSEITGKWRRSHVYCPAEYDRKTRSRYPVLYLQHGAGENERGWVEQGRANFILDGLIASGAARPMIVVCDSGYAMARNAPPSTNAWTAPIAAFEDVLLKELIPSIDDDFRTRTGREDRAMAGLSMGGMQTLGIALKHLDRFAWIAAMSAPPRQGFEVATAYDGVFRDSARFNREVCLLWLGAGTAEERFLAGTKTMHEALAAAGIPSVLYASPGTDHEWQTWRRSLRDLAPRLFRRASQ
ncbi:MAG: hypothetical protein IT581_22850 [Verrucomicrobiales bacterium]|nr:hypothetical protein [Verrucomicrobiales bacterium]